ncbi:MAG: type IV secretion system DNA-binding domain-containing protein [Aridibacter famidurans]|nr:type IV secretion system DNA-binding domain-containing protein [Aridibacter famidurans]
MTQDVQSDKQIADLDRISLLAETDYRNSNIPFGIKRTDRRSHIWLLGKTGTGKSTMIENLMFDDLNNGYGFALLDPHGDLVSKVRSWIPSTFKDSFIDFDVPNEDQGYGFNPLSGVGARYRPLAASGLIQVFKHLWRDAWGARTEHILRNSILSLLDYPNATLPDILKLLADNDFRKKVLPYITSKQVRLFWEDEFQKYSYRFRAFAVSPIQNKVGAFLSHPLVRNILTNPKEPINFRQIVDEGKILLVDLSKGTLGEDVANLLGSLIISRFDLAALSRSNVPERKRRDYTLFLDEFHSFTTHGLAFMLSSLRKYNVSLVLANQYIPYQLLPEVREALFGNVGTIVSFRLGAKDAEAVSREFASDIEAKEFTNLPNYRVYLRMMIDGKVSKPFSAKTLPPVSAN